MTNSTTFEHLQVRKIVPVKPERAFEAWTNPDELKQWWGPEGVTCLSAEVDLQPGGQYKIANQLPDKSVLWITGVFEVIERPHLLVFTWSVEKDSPVTERVNVRFDRHELGTDVVVTHERIATRALSEQHERGWIGCLDGLVEYLVGIDPSSARS